MPIKEPLLFISVEDFKTWKGFDKLLFENVTNSDENIWFAIAIASSNIDYLSGFAISKKWHEQTITAFTDNVQTATAHYVRFLCTKGVDYTRGQASMAQGGIVYSESNPNDPYYIPPEVFNYLRNIKEYTAFQGFNLNVNPKTSFFSKFLSNKGEINPLENYLQITNTIAGNGVEIAKTHPENIMGTVVTFNINNNFIANDIIIKKEYSNLKTLDSTILGAINEIYSFSKIKVDTISFSLVANFLKLNDDAISKRFNDMIEYTNLKTISKTIVGALNELKTSTQIDTNNYYTKNEINNELNKKQNQLVNNVYTTIASNNTIDINTIFNQQLALELLLTNNYPQLTTTDKSIIKGINELKKDIDLLKKQHNYFHFLSEKDNKENEIIILMGQITIGNDLEKNVYTIASNNVLNPCESAKYGTRIYLDLGDEFNCYKLNSGTREISKKIKGVWKNNNDTILSCVGIDVNMNFDTKIATLIFRENKDKPSPTTLTLNLSSL